MKFEMKVFWIMAAIIWLVIVPLAWYLAITDYIA